MLTLQAIRILCDRAITTKKDEHIDSAIKAVRLMFDSGAVASDNTIFNAAVRDINALLKEKNRQPLVFKQKQTAVPTVQVPPASTFMPPPQYSQPFAAPQQPRQSPQPIPFQLTGIPPARIPPPISIPLNEYFQPFPALPWKRQGQPTATHLTATHPAVPQPIQMRQASVNESDEEHLNFQRPPWKRQKQPTATRPAVPQPIQMRQAFVNKSDEELLKEFLTQINKCDQSNRTEFIFSFPLETLKRIEEYIEKLDSQPAEVAKIGGVLVDAAIEVSRVRTFLKTIDGDNPYTLIQIGDKLVSLIQKQNILVALLNEQEKRKIILDKIANTNVIQQCSALLFSNKNLTAEHLTDLSNDTCQKLLKKSVKNPIYPMWFSSCLFDANPNFLEFFKKECEEKGPTWMFSNSELNSSKSAETRLHKIAEKYNFQLDRRPTPSPILPSVTEKYLGQQLREVIEQDLMDALLSTDEIQKEGEQETESTDVIDSKAAGKISKKRFAEEMSDGDSVDQNDIADESDAKAIGDDLGDARGAKRQRLNSEGGWCASTDSAGKQKPSASDFPGTMIEQRASFSRLFLPAHPEAKPTELAAAREKTQKENKVNSATLQSPHVSLQWCDQAITIFKNLAHKKEIAYQDKTLTVKTHQAKYLQQLAQLLETKNKDKEKSITTTVESPTGTGKTFMIGFTVLGVLGACKQNKVLIVTSRLNIAPDIKKTLTQCGIKDESICTHNSQEKTGDLKDFSVTITLYNSLMANPAFFAKQGYALVVFDEAHHADAEKAQKVIQSLVEQGGVFIGFSATPREIQKTLGKPVFTYRTEDAIKEGMLVPFLNIFIRPNVAFFRSQKLEFSDKTSYFARIFSDTYLNVSDPCGKSLFKKSTIVFVQGIEAVKIFTHEVNGLLKQFNEGKEMACAVHSDNLQSQNRRALNNFKDGTYPILVNSDMCKEGFDHPPTESIFIFANSSKDVLTQVAGRALRTSPNKERALIFQFIDGPKTEIFGKLDQQSSEGCVVEPHCPSLALTEGFSRQEKTSIFFKGTPVQLVYSLYHHQLSTLKAQQQIDSDVIRLPMASQPALLIEPPVFLKAPPQATLLAVHGLHRQPPSNGNQGGGANQETAAQENPFEQRKQANLK